MTGNQLNKKNEERASLDLLISLYPGFPAGKIVHTESPDFIIHSGPRKKIGVELTRYTQPGFNPNEETNHFIPELTRNGLLDVINAKEQKIPIYQKKILKRIWLVILVEGFSNSPSFNIQNQLESWKIDSLFESVMLLDLMGERVYVL
ncbi:MAG: hypothetical protein KAT15_15400 [Bacteroidales bacterium]|nr:hypothetical protein [Bacteroidales bacterium]